VYPEPVISDFGCAERFATSSQMGKSALTTYFASFQQRNGMKFGRKANVWSYGIVALHCMLKVGGMKRVSKKLMKDDGFGSMGPGLFQQVTIDDVVTRALHNITKPLPVGTLQFILSMMQRDICSSSPFSRSIRLTREFDLKWSGVSRILKVMSST